ncbi:MAG: TonB-dependent receptor [Tidjanibacter sp.]|nr:TonB-dependent receptor [Tidjanibacter sp.]
MKKLFALLLLVCGFGLANAVATTPVIPKPSPTDAHIFGHVIDKATGIHIPYVAVVIEGTTIGVVTDATGHYIIKNMTPGTYTVEVSAVGYISATKQVKVVAGQTHEVEFELVEDAVTLDQIVVSSNRSETLKREAPSLVSVVDSEIFDRVSSASLAGGLAYQPGVRVENTCQNCGFPQVRINGLDGRYSQILVDSHPLFSSLTGVYGMEQIPANMIERVEVMRGGGSALYGASAIGGTINIITKEPKQSVAEMSHTTTAIAMGGAMENATTLNASLVSDSGKAAVSVFAQSRTSGGYDVDGDGFTELLESNSEALGMRSVFRTSNYSRITAQYHRIKDYRRGGDQLDKPQHLAEVCEQADHTIDGGSVTFDWSDPTHTNRLNIYTSFQNTARKSYYGAGQDPNAYGRTHDLMAAAGVQYVHEFDHLLFMPSNLTVGSEVSHNNLHDTSLGYNIDTKQIANIYGVYFQNEWRNKQWSILLGGRLDKHNMISAPIFSPRANLRYNPTEEISLRLSYAGGYRAPQAYDEDLHVAIVGGERTRIVLDPNLKEERSSSWSASAEFYHTFGTVATNLIVEGFHTRLDDVFALREKGHDSEGVAIQERYNGSGATVSGVNIEGRALLSRKLELQAGFTLQRSRYAEPEQWSETAPASLDMFRTPDAYGYFTLMYKPTARLNIDLTGNYTGPMWVQHYTGYIIEDRVERTENFMDVSARIGYTTLVYDDTFIELFGGVKNIFNSYQSDFDKGANRDSGYVYGPLQPHSIYLGAEIRF